MQEVNAHLIKHFYTSFKHGDFLAMQECYHSDIEFSDPVFPYLQNNEAKAMWHMLVESGVDSGLQISFDDIQVFKDSGECTWEAQYRFSLSGRNVHNVIRAKFWFRGGLIVKHQDNFDFWKWSRMAFGVKGLILGWTPFFKKKVQEGIALRLAKFIDRHPEYA